MQNFRAEILDLDGRKATQARLSCFLKINEGRPTKTITPPRAQRIPVAAIRSRALDRLRLIL
jgi:hypothetical protein